MADNPPWTTEEERLALAAQFDAAVARRKARQQEFVKMGDDTEFHELLERLRKRYGGNEAAPEAIQPLSAPVQLPACSRDDVKRRGVPEIHIAHVYDRNPEDCQALQAVRAFLDAEQQVFLVLVGGPGTRKSGSAAWALTQGSGRFVGAAELGRIAISKAEDDAVEFRQCRKVPLLVIDDVGAEYDSDWFKTVLSDVCNARYEELRKTILTTNLAPDALVKAYGRRLGDRLRESGEFIACPGKSQRPDYHWSSPDDREEP